MNYEEFSKNMNESFKEIKDIMSFSEKYLKKDSNNINDNIETKQSSSSSKSGETQQNSTSYNLSKGKIIQDDIIQPKENTSYNMSRNKIIQDDLAIPQKRKISKNKTTKPNSSKTETSKNFLMIFMQVLLKIYHQFMNNQSIRNIVSNICKFICHALCYVLVLYCLLVPFEEIKFHVVTMITILLFVFNYLSMRLWIEHINICPKCHENNAMEDLGVISKTPLSSKRVENEREIYDLVVYKYVEQEKCRYCGYIVNKEYKKSPEKRHVKYTEHGLRMLEIERMEEAKINIVEAEQRARVEADEEIARHQRYEDALKRDRDMQMQKELNEHRQKLRDESWERRRRGY